MRTLSPAARRAVAIERSYPRWSLTHGRPTRWLHIGASFERLELIGQVRRLLPTLPEARRPFYRSMVQDALTASRFNISLYPERLP